MMSFRNTEKHQEDECKLETKDMRATEKLMMTQDEPETTREALAPSWLPESMGEESPILSSSEWTSSPIDSVITQPGTREVQDVTSPGAPLTRREKVNLVVFGYGTVGKGFVRALKQAEERILETTGLRFEVLALVDLADMPDDPYAHLIVRDGSTYLTAPNVDIIVECMGGTGYAYEVTREALANGKSVVSSNKALVERHGAELLAIANKNQCIYAFEASVGGAIHLLQPLEQLLRTNQVDEVIGILNGTSNFILTLMAQEGIFYSKALQQAQNYGYAEADPTDDVTGQDSRRKLSILASMIERRDVPLESIPCRGIEDLMPEDFSWGAELRCRLALLAIYRRGKLQVSPFYLPLDNPLAMVQGVYNSVLLHADLAGDMLFYGEGAGGLATASALLTDVLQIATGGYKVELKARQSWSAFKQTTEDESWESSEPRFAWRYAFRFKAEAIRRKLDTKRRLLEACEIHETRGGAPGILAISKDLMSHEALRAFIAETEPEQAIPIFLREELEPR